MAKKEKKEMEGDGRAKEKWMINVKKG